MSSKKLKRLVLIMIAVLAIAIAGYLIADGIISRKEKKLADEAASLHLFEFDSNSISQVTLDGKEGFFKFEVVDSAWAITETDYPNPITLNSAYVSTVCSYMGNLTAATKFQVDTSKLADYGLADPVVLTCSDGRTEYTLHVGNATPTQEYFYVMVPGNDTVYGVSFDYGSVLSGPVTLLKSPYMLNYSEVDIAEVSLERENKMVFDLVMKNDQWKMLAPMPEANIVSAEVDSLLTSLTRLQLDSYVGFTTNGFDLADYGLRNPYCTLKVKSTDNSETIIDFAKPDANNGISYLFFRNENEIASMATEHLNFLKVEMSEFINPRILTIPIETVSALDAAVDGISFRMEMDAAAGIQKFDGTDISTLDSNAASTFKMLYDSIANLEFETIDTNAQVDVTAEPAAVFRYTRTDGTETELSLIAIDDTMYWAVVDGEYTGMTVRRRAISGNTGVLNFHERMVDMIAEAE